VIDALLLAALLAQAPGRAEPTAAPASPPPGPTSATRAAPAPPAGPPGPDDAGPYDDAWLEAALARPAPPPSAGAPRLPPAAAGAWLRRAAALSVDALPGARALRQPLPARPAVDGTLDALTAGEKGAALLAAAEAYVGADRWAAALAALEAAPSGPPMAAPLLDALAATAGPDVSRALAGLLATPGAPLLRVEVRCERGGARAVVLQERLAPGPGPARAVTVPACLRTGGARGEATVCTLLGGPRAEVALPFCPTWLWPNAGGAGYHVSALAPRDLPRLWPRLTAEERLGLAVDAALLARRGALPHEDALALVAPLSRDPDPRGVAAALLLARLVEPRWLGPAEHARWRAFLRRTFGARARGLGWLPRPDDGEAARALRPVLLPLLAGEGEEAVLAGEALALARRWLFDRRQVPAEVAWPALLAAAHHGDQDLLERVVAEAARAEPAERTRLSALLGRFREPGPAAAALALAAAPGTAPADAAALLGEALAGRDTRPAAMVALRQGWEQLVPRLAPAEAARLVDAAARTACEPAARAEVAALLSPRLAGLDGAVRALALALEEADACLTARARGAAAVARLLAR
jgi:ERAP1-like protein